VDTRTLAEQVHDRLLTLALTEGYQSQRLTVVKLAKRLGVSRTPVRRAVDRLAASGLVVSGRRRGVFFTRIDPERVREVYEVRAELEGLAAQLSASNIEESVVESLLRENRQLVRGPGAKDHSRLVAQEVRIHQAIAEACGQSYLRKLLQDVFELVRAFQFAGYRAPQMAQRAVREHGLILDAIRRRQGNLARRRMVRHVRNTCWQIMAAVRARSMAHV
jgi:DNA-binding GntR family transcriptional regulator